jgi:hypothetical protein
MFESPVTAMAPLNSDQWLRSSSKQKTPSCSAQLGRLSQIATRAFARKLAMVVTSASRIAFANGSISLCGTCTAFDARTQPLRLWTSCKKAVPGLVPGRGLAQPSLVPLGNLIRLASEAESRNVSGL